MKNFLILGFATLVAATAVAEPNVVAWGDNSYGQCQVPADLTNAVAVAGGASHSLALRSDGTVVAWGDNRYGETDIPAGLSNVVAICAGALHDLALRKDGTIVAWGTGYSGEADVPAGLSNVVAIAAGVAHSLALRADGTVAVWGDDAYGQTDAPAGLSNVVAIAAGASHCLALRADGTVLAWGMYLEHLWGEYYYPMTVPADVTDIVSIGSSYCQSVALKADGTVAVWDHVTEYWNEFAGSGQVVGLAGGSDHFLALGADGTVVGWGENGDGEALAPAGLRNAVAVGAGASHSLAVIGAGPPVAGALQPDRQVAQAVGTAALYARVAGDWPLSCQWELDGADLPGATNAWLVLRGGLPAQAGVYSVRVSNASGTVTSAGARLTVVPALFTASSPDQVGYLGGGAAFQIQVQASRPLTYQWRFDGREVPGQTNAALALEELDWAQAGTYSVQVSNQFGTAWSPEARLGVANVAAWGNDQTADGYSLLDQIHAPADLTNAVAVAAGEAHSLALRPDGTVVGWGGAVGLSPPYGPAEVPLDLRDVVGISAGPGHSLAVRGDGTVIAWGDDDHGQTDVPIGLTNVVGIAAGEYDSLALLDDGTVVAWGGGYVSVTNVPARLTNVVAVAGGGGQSLALLADGTVAGWGEYAVPPGLSNVVAVACGIDHSLALRSDGTVQAWGSNLAAQTNVPPGLSDVVAIAAGSYFSLALLSDGTVTAWGYGDFGQTNVPADLRNVVGIAGGRIHALAVVSAGPPTLFPPLSKASLSNGVFSVSVPTCSGRVYALEFKDSLADSAWTTLFLSAGTGKTRALADRAATSRSRFYRVRQW